MPEITCIVCGHRASLRAGVASHDESFRNLHEVMAEVDSLRYPERSHGEPRRHPERVRIVAE